MNGSSQLNGQSSSYLNGNSHLNGNGNGNTNGDGSLLPEIPIPVGPTNQPRILVRSLDERETVFQLSGVEMGFANSLRRVMMADVPTVGELDEYTLNENVNVNVGNWQLVRIGLGWFGLGDGIVMNGWSFGLGERKRPSNLRLLCEACGSVL